MRQGNFSELLTAPNRFYNTAQFIRDPLASGNCNATDQSACFPGNVIPASRLSPQGLALLRSYPTANIALDRYLRPRYGIYAVRGRLQAGRVLEGAANLGIRPSFDPPKELLEAYFFDFDDDLYGQTLEIELHAYIRPEARFDSLDALTAQMQADCTEARRLLRA